MNKRKTLVDQIRNVALHPDDAFNDQLVDVCTRATTFSVKLPMAKHAVLNAHPFQIAACELQARRRARAALPRLIRW